MCDDRKTVWPRFFAFEHGLPERHLHQRIEAASGLVEDQDVCPAREGSDELHLLAVAMRKGADLLVRFQLEAFDEPVAIRPIRFMA